MIKESILRWARARAPDFVIGGTDAPYLLRWWLLPRNKFFNVYVHQFLRSDDDRAHHDHPWLFNASWLIDGEYIEHTITAGGALVRTQRKTGAFEFRWGSAPHRLQLIGNEGDPPNVPFMDAEPCWTVFITGPRVREWGFCCMERGWIHWERFTAQGKPGEIGRGCDQ